MFLLLTVRLLQSNCPQEYNLQVVVGTELLFFMSLLLLLFYSTVTVCTVYVAHSVSAVLYFVFFAGGLFWNA